MLLEPADSIDLPGVAIVSRGEYELVLEVDSSVQSMESVISGILAHCPVADITIADPPLEEIIVDIYGRR